MAFPSTADRVARNTAPEVNARIRRQTVGNIVRARSRGGDGVELRLRELDCEWDIERAIEANAAAFGLAGLALGIFVDRRLLLLPAAVGGFLLQHALQGWCPPVSLLRRLGFRTAREIFEERIVLKASLAANQRPV